MQARRPTCVRHAQRRLSEGRRALAANRRNTKSTRGQIEAIASRDKDELLVHDTDFDKVREVRNLGQFFRDRRPEAYGVLTEIG